MNIFFSHCFQMSITMHLEWFFLSARGKRIGFEIKFPRVSRIWPPSKRHLTIGDEAHMGFDIWFWQKVWLLKYPYSYSTGDRIGGGVKTTIDRCIMCILSESVEYFPMNYMKSNWWHIGMGLHSPDHNILCYRYRHFSKQNNRKIVISPFYIIQGGI